MRALLPKSLIGQLALLMAVALLVAQAINFSLIFDQRQRLSRARLEGPSVSRFVTLAQRLAPLPAETRRTVAPERIWRGRISLDAQSAVPPAAADAALTQRLRENAADNGVAIRDARAAIEDRMVVRRGSGRGGKAEDEPRPRAVRMLTLSLQFQDGSWINGRLYTRRPDPWVAARSALATILTYLIILGAMLWLARRIARPLRELTAAAERFEGRGEAPQVAPRGPDDVRRAMLAFNAMSARVSAMLDEKDRMLGAIGHDLRTPLASLRIRAESVEPEEERLRMIATIEEMTAMLDDTLALARSGRAVEEPRNVDITALADTVVEEFRELGHDVVLEESARIATRIQPRLLRRAVRNLVENAVTYAGSASVAICDLGEQVAVEVSDTGPGIPPELIERVQEPFFRVEPSRSRETGGSGLGLTLARAAAQAHGGMLELENRANGGLTARIFLPKGD